MRHHRPLTLGSLQGWGSLQGRESQYLPSPDTGMATRLLAGCTTGAVAVACAQPTDVVKVRFQASRVLSDSVRRYSGTVDAYRTIAREEGIRGLWRGRSGQGGPWKRDWGKGRRTWTRIGTAGLGHHPRMLQEGL